ncbi:MAG: class I SAM-dependent methyltransferase [bacterium]
MKKELIPPIQESDLPFPYKEELLLKEGVKLGNPEKIFHEIYGFGKEKNELSGIYESDFPFIKAHSFDLIQRHIEDYEQNIIRMLKLGKKSKSLENWKSRDMDRASELALKWPNPNSQTHFLSSISLFLPKLVKIKHQNIVELGTGTGLFTLSMVDQLLKNGQDRFTIISGDINVSCITYAWIMKQFFIYRDLDIHSYIFSQENLTLDMIESIRKRHLRSIIFVVSPFSDMMDRIGDEWADLVISNHATSYQSNKLYKKLIEKIKEILKPKGIFIEDSLNNYRMGVESNRLKKRVILGRNRIRGNYEPEYTIVQKERDVPTIVDMKSPTVDKACDWIRSMTFNPTFKPELELFQESLGKTQKTQRDLNPVALDHKKEHEYAGKIGLKEVTPKEFITEIFISTKIFQKV